MRRFYKSRLFWLGVPGLVFLLWAWWDSGGYSSSVAWARGKRDVSVQLARGDLRWTQITIPDESGVWSPHFNFDRWEMDADWENIPRGRQFDFTKAFAREEGVEAFGEERLDVWVALWVIVLGYVVVWVGTVFAWRWRKVRVMKRLTESSERSEVAG